MFFCIYISIIVFDIIIPISVEYSDAIVFLFVYKLFLMGMGVCVGSAWVQVASTLNSRISTRQAELGVHSKYGTGY